VDEVSAASKEADRCAPSGTSGGMFFGVEPEALPAIKHSKSQKSIGSICAHAITYATLFARG
jgi:hypothetical protein